MNVMVLWNAPASAGAFFCVKIHINRRAAVADFLLKTSNGRSSVSFGLQLQAASQSIIEKTAGKTTQPPLSPSLQHPHVSQRRSR